MSLFKNQFIIQFVQFNFGLKYIDESSGIFRLSHDQLVELLCNFSIAEFTRISF